MSMLVMNANTVMLISEFSACSAASVRGAHLVHGDVAVKLDGVRNVWAHDLPGVSKVQPIVRRFALKPV